MLSPSLEDYLEEIYRISQRGETVRVTDIASCLNVSLPSVTKALHRLHEAEYINYRRYKDIVLTDKGKIHGHFLVERNRIIQEFLTLIGSQCDVAGEAEAMEHYLSLATLEAIMNFVKFARSHPEVLQRYQEFCQKQPSTPIPSPGPIEPP